MLGQGGLLLTYPRWTGQLAGAALRMHLRGRFEFPLQRPDTSSS
jgi:hypothetical protein